MLSRAGILYLASFVAHGALAAGVVSIKGERHYEDVSISIVEPAKKKEREIAPPPPDVPPAAPTVAPAPKQAKLAARAVEPAPSDAPSPAAASASDGVPDFGLSLGGGSGPGLAVRGATPAPVASALPPPVHRVLNAAPPPKDACDEPLKKPRPIAIAQPAYTAEARAANVAGKVRVEITVDGAGKVTSVRVLEGLGYGLDDAALAAARAATFEPGTKCGKPVNATFTVAMRFTL